MPDPGDRILKGGKVNESAPPRKRRGEVGDLVDAEQKTQRKRAVSRKPPGSRNQETGERRIRHRLHIGVLRPFLCHRCGQITFDQMGARMGQFLSERSAG